MLTPKQEIFVQQLVKGKSQREAYKAAYNAENMLDSTIDSEASILFKNQKISERYRELINKADDEAIMSATERKKWLTKLINDEMFEEALTNKGDIIQKQASFSDKMKALDLLNKMGGEYVQKIEAEVDNNVVINIGFDDNE